MNAPTIPEEFPEGVTLRDPEDHTATRRAIYDGVKDELISAFPQSYGGVRMELTDVDYDDPEDVDIADQKKALLSDKFLARRLRGTVRLVDEASNETLDEKSLSLMRVPHMTERGTFVHGGNEYANISQARLIPGVFTRRQANGLLETQFNVRPGTGSGFRVGFEPDTAQYRLKANKANLHLYSLLHDLGVPDENLERSWGADVLEANRAKYDSRVLDKAFEKLVPPRLRKDAADLSPEQKGLRIKEAFEAAKITEYSTRKNLPNYFNTKLAKMWLDAEPQPQPVKEAHAEEPVWEVVYPDYERPCIPVPQIPQISGVSWYTPDSMAKQAVQKTRGLLFALLPPWERFRIVAWVQDNIPKRYLADNGYERNPHVDILEGFSPEFKVQTLIQHFSGKFGRKPRELELGKVRRSPAHDGRPDADLLYVEVTSPSLLKLRKALSAEYPEATTEAEPNNKMRLVLARIKPGSLTQLDGHAEFNGEAHHVDDLVYSAPESEKQTHIYLDD